MTRLETCMSVLLIALLAATVALAQERAVPDNPVPATVTEYRIIAFSQERDPDWRFVITFKDNNGRVYQDIHHGLSIVETPTGPVTRAEGADALLKQLNTMNFSTTSLTKRLLQHLVQHNKIPAATVTGTPE